MGKRRRKKAEICSSISLEPQEKRRLHNKERHVLREPTKPLQECKNEVVQFPGDELTIQAQEMNLNSPSVSLSDTEEAWMMQTSIAYEYDFTCEHATCMECWDTHEENHDESKKVAEEATVQGEVNKDGNRRLNAKKESREEKIKGLKALLRKQEKAVKKLTGVHTTTQTQSSLSRSVECKVKNSRANHSAVTKGCSRQRLGARGRKSRRKLESCNSVASTRDVDIWMSRGDLITKDEFLAVVGLVRVAKFH